MDKPQSIGLLRQAVRQFKATPEQKTEKQIDALEQAMLDFKNAETPAEQAAAFRAALELAKAD